MNTSFNTKHFTYHSGTSSEINSSRSICYYARKYADGSDQISITGLSEYYEKLKESYQDGEYVSWSRRVEVESGTDYFLIKPNIPESDIIEFDTIIYIGNSGSPVGYTYFSEVQTNYDGNSRIGEMKLSFYFHMSSNIVDFDTSFTLEPIWTTKNPLILDNFVTDRTEIIDYYNSQTQGKTDYLRYTDDVIQVASGSDKYCCISDSGVILKDSTYKYWIPEVSLETLVKYTKYTVGYNSGKLVLYRWNKSGQYSVDSLTEYNHFGILKNIRKGQVELEDSESINTLVDNMVVLDKGKYLRCGYIDMKTGHKYLDTTKRIINDPWDSSDNVSLVSSTLVASESGILDLSVNPGKYYYLIEKYGPWYVFYNSNVSCRAWCSMYGTAYFSETDTVIPVSSRMLVRLKREEITNNTIDIYLLNGNTVFYEGSKPTYTMNHYYSLPNNFDPVEKSCIEIIDGLRHRPLPSKDLSFLQSNPVGFRGMIFYLSSDNKIKLL